ncbi:MAG: hypothetical protein QOC66_3923 [Pseudonocardiales bacterium]|jgi:uncharacterized membrane protein|nr:hypothetical protein [Pseudonocardiales bacterium]
MAERNSKSSKGKGVVKEAASGDGLGGEFQHLLSVVADRVLSSATDRVGGLTDKLSGLGDGGSAAGKAVAKAGEKTMQGKSPLMAGLSAGAEGIKSKVGEALGGGKGGKGGGKKIKVTNIIEQVDVGAPLQVVYNQWTQFQDFSNFMKKVEGVDQKDEQKLTFKAQVLWSHRSWEATIVDQVPDERIVWRSKGAKGHVDGAVTFHEIAPDLTRVLVVLEYHPQGLFERTGNLWRAQGRRARLELKHFRRHVMTQAMLHPDELQGWRGEIHDSKVTKSDEDARREEEQDDDDDLEDEYEEDDEYDEGEEADEDEGDEEDDADDEEQSARKPRSRSRARAGRR